MATTPPPPPLRTPTTPRHGARFDAWESFPTRHSTRLAHRRISQEIPMSPASSSPSSLVRADSSPGGTSQQHSQSEGSTLSPPYSKQNSPRRKGGSGGNQAKPDRLDHSLSYNIEDQAFTNVVTSPEPSNNAFNINKPRTSMAGGMLPTPGKTPRKKVASTAGPTVRKLFANQSQAMDSEILGPRRVKGKKFAGFSLESFNTDHENVNQNKISIFTDSRDRIPEVNNSKDNVFIKKSGDATDPDANPVDGIIKRRKTDAATGPKRDKEIEKALNKDDGMLYVFRGKKTFRKFKPETEDDDPTDLGLLASRPDLLDGSIIPRVRPLTRSSIKPRLLFPNAAQLAARGLKANNPNEMGTPKKQDDIPDEVIAEPINSGTISFDHAPVTPPSRTIVSTPSSPRATGRSLRSHVKKIESESEVTPSGPDAKPAKRISPFDGWLRTKSQSTPSKTKRRFAGPLECTSEPVLKKSRSK